MKAWPRETTEIMNFVLGKPSTTSEAVVIGAVGVLALLLVMKAFSSAAGSGDSGWARRIVSAVLMLAVALFTAVATSCFITPQVHDVLLDKVALFGLPLVALLFIAVPLMAVLLKTRYGGALTAAAISMFACIVATLVVGAICDSFRGGNRGFSQVKQRTDTLDRFMDR